MAYQIKKGELRLPLVRSADEVDQLQNLTDKEKEILKGLMATLPPTDGWFMMANDPHTMCMWQFVERELTSQHEGDTQMRILGGFMSLAALTVVNHSRGEYLADCMNQSAIIGLMDQDRKDEILKLLLIPYPENQIWSEEERLTINFVNAFLDSTMTDELFQQALDTWGEQMTLRHMSWIAFVWFNQKFQNATALFGGMDHMSEGGATEEVAQSVVNFFAPTKDMFLDWYTSNFAADFMKNENWDK